MRYNKNHKNHIVLALILYFPITTFCAINWNIEYNNSSDSAVVITVDSKECFHLDDFNNYVVIPAKSKVITNAKENNDGMCNGTFYSIHQLNLKLTFLDNTTHSPTIQKFITYKNDFSNAPLTRPKTSLVTDDGAIHRHNNDDSYGRISASKSNVYGKIIVDFNNDLIPVIEKITK